MSNPTQQVLQLQNPSIVGIFLSCLGFVVLFAVAQLFPVTLLPSQDLIESKTVWLPPNNSRHELSSALNQTYKPFQGVLGTSNFQIESWMRLRIRQVPEPSVLFLGPAFHELFDVYQRLSNGTWVHQRTGLQVPDAKRPLHTLGLGVPLQADPGLKPNDTMEVLVRGRSRSAFIQVQAYTFRDLAQYDGAVNVSLGLYMGLSMLIVGIGLIAYSAFKQSLWLDAVGYDLAFVCYAVMQSGFLLRYLQTDLSAYAFDLYVLSIACVIVALCRFYSETLKMFNVPPHVRHYYKSGYGVAAVMAALVLADLHQFALAAGNFFLVMSNLWGFYTLVRVNHPNRALVYIYRGLLGFYIAVSLTYVGASIFKLELNHLTVFLASAQNNFFTLFLMLLLLGYQAWLSAQQGLEIERESQRLSARLEAEQDKLAEASSFLSMVIHEIKNPLNFVRLASINLANRYADAPETRRTLTHIEESISSIDRILERTVQVDGLDQGGLKINIQTHDLAPLISDFVAVQPLTHRVEWICPEQALARTDAELLLLMVRNLMDNALKYSPAESKVAMALTRRTKGWKIEVLNEAGVAGLPDPERLFQKYYRAQTALHVSGTGLGLYWVAEVAKRMGGRIAYRNQGKSVLFELWIPD